MEERFKYLISSERFDAVAQPFLDQLEYERAVLHELIDIRYDIQKKWADFWWFYKHCGVFVWTSDKKEDVVWEPIEIRDADRAGVMMELLPPYFRKMSIDPYIEK